MNKPIADKVLGGKRVGQQMTAARLPYSVLFASVLHQAAQLSLGGMIILIPFRFRGLLWTNLVPPIYSDYTNLLFFASDAFLIAALVFWMLGLAFQPRRVSLGSLWLTIPLVGLTLAAALSVLTSVDRPLSLYHLVRLILLFGLYLYVINEIKSLSQIILPVSLQVIIQSVVGVAQSLKQHSLDWTWLQELALDPAWSGVSIVWSSGMRSLRAYGLSDHPNILGGCLAFSLLLVAAWYLRAGGNQRILAAGVFSLGSLALLLTFSRSAWLGFGCGLALMAFWLVAHRRKSDLLAGLSLLVVVFIMLLPSFIQNAPYLRGRLNVDGSFSAASPENQAINERLLLITQANTIFAGNPLTGIGLGAFPVAMRQQVPDYLFHYQPPHFVLVDIAAETGIFGALFYGLLLFVPWTLLFVQRRRLVFSWKLLGASAALLAVSVISFLDYYPWMLNAGRQWQWLIWGLWVGAYSAGLKRDDHA